MMSVLVMVALFGSALAAPPDSNCGKPAISPSQGNSKEDGRIVGGKEAVPHSWPWQGQVRYFGGHYCGFSLLSANWALSAAHCFRGANVNRMTFHLGRHGVSGLEDTEQIANAVVAVTHELYNPNTLNNDVAVIQLTPDIKYANEVSPVCLPASTEELKEGENVHVTGWGNTENTCCPTVLKQVMVPVIGRSKCNQRDYYNGAITNAMFCAGLDEGGLDSCQGDSGGPVVIEKGGLWEQHGIVSWGYGCAEPKKPGVYTSVTYMKDWILKTATRVEREQALVAQKFRPSPFGAAFREVSRELVEKGEVQKEDLPMGGAWLE